MNRARSSAAILGLVVSSLSTGCMEFAGPPEPVELDDARRRLARRGHLPGPRRPLRRRRLATTTRCFDRGTWRATTAATGRASSSKLDYLEELGVTTLWISPVVKNVETDAGRRRATTATGRRTSPSRTRTSATLADAPRASSRPRTSANMKVVLDIVDEPHGPALLLRHEPQRRARHLTPGRTRPRSPGARLDSPASRTSPSTTPTSTRAASRRSPRSATPGLAPVIFAHDPRINRVPPTPASSQTPRAYNRKGRTCNYDDPRAAPARRLPRRPEGRRHRAPDVRDAMIDAYARWVELTDLDGFRIDTVKHVEYEFWRQFTPKVRQRLAAKGKTQLPHVRRGLRRQRRARRRLHEERERLPAARPTSSPRENRCVTDGPTLTGGPCSTACSTSRSTFRCSATSSRYRGPDPNDPEALGRPSRQLRRDAGPGRRGERGGPASRRTKLARQLHRQP